MYMHIDNTSYSERRAGVATSGSVCGVYTYRGSFKPLGHDSLDDNLFLDGATGYFISEDRTNAKLQIYQLSADFLSVTSLVKTAQPVRVAGHGEGQRHVLPLRLPPDRMDHQRQPVRDGDFDRRHVERLAQLRAVGHEHLQLADHHRSSRSPGSSTHELRLPRRPVELRQPDRLPLRVAAADRQRHHRLDHLSGELDLDTATGRDRSAGAAEIYYRITARHSGKVMDVISASTANNAEVKQWTLERRRQPEVGVPGRRRRLLPAGQPEQRQVPRRGQRLHRRRREHHPVHLRRRHQPAVAVGATGGYFQLVARHSGKCLDVVSANTADGADIQQYTCGTGTNQQWSRTQSYACPAPH